MWPSPSSELAWLCWRGDGRVLGVGAMKSRLGFNPAASAASPCSSRPPASRAPGRGGGEVCGAGRCAGWGARVRLSQQLLLAVRTAVSVKKVSRSSGGGVLAADTPLGLLGKGCREGVPACPLPRGYVIFLVIPSAWSLMSQTEGVSEIKSFELMSKALEPQNGQISPTKSHGWSGLLPPP